MNKKGSDNKFEINYDTILKLQEQTEKQIK